MTQVVKFTDRAERALFPQTSHPIPEGLLPIIMWALGMVHRNHAGEIITIKGPHYMMGWHRREELDPRCILVELEKGTVAVRLRPESQGVPSLIFDFDDAKKEFVEVEGR